MSIQELLITCKAFDARFNIVRKGFTIETSKYYLLVLRLGCAYDGSVMRNGKSLETFVDMRAMDIHECLHNIDNSLAYLYDCAIDVMYEDVKSF